ncbi:MAG: carboxyl transferase domain-containing protein [Isosphaeraceae bacterium]
MTSTDARPDPRARTARERDLREASRRLREDSEILRKGGGEQAAARQRAKGRMTARERIAALVDPNASWLELGLWAGYQMYAEWGGAPAAGVVTGIGRVADRTVMVVANDATVKAGAFFPMTIKKVLRAQQIAARNRLPLIYLVDSSGVFLPMQDEVFPDDDDFGRIFRNNAVISAAGIPQIAAIMGNCVAGGAYLPVLCDTLLMTEGSGLYLAGPALVKAAIGQEVTSEQLGGAHVHAAISGTVDFHEPDDPTCLERIRRLVGLLPPDPSSATSATVASPSRTAEDLFEIVRSDPSAQYDVRDVLAALVDGGSFDEYRPDFGRTLACGFGKWLGGRARIGLVASQRLRIPPWRGEVRFTSVVPRRQCRQGRSLRARL